MKGLPHCYDATGRCMCCGGIRKDDTLQARNDVSQDELIQPFMKLPPEATARPAKVPNEFEQRAEAAYEQTKQTFLTDHADEWRNRVGAQLNTLLGRVQYEMSTCLPPDREDVEFAEAAIAMVERVAYFDKIERVGSRAASDNSIPTHPLQVLAPVSTWRQIDLLASQIEHPVVAFNADPAVMAQEVIVDTKKRASLLRQLIPPAGRS